MVMDPSIFFTMVFHSFYMIYKSAVEPEIKILLDSMIGFAAALLFLLIDLLWERPDDLMVWRRVQACMLLVDVSTTCAYFGALSVLGAQTWLWVKLCVVVVTAIVRIAFLKNIGLRKRDREEEP